MDISNFNTCQTIWTDRPFITHKTRSPISHIKQRSPLTTHKTRSPKSQCQTAIA
ncbi:hypothetical protein H6F44_17810 [Pseudanabaena sp. FACHB-1277]|uniref:Uncharacterized protein n=1 Tax=Pseudanabaena cinerea FACHB-1277 TaxID=2949581 RepID=A0A926UW79_9CYAN|nr:hypothetical protein [Pseudanabaena cinerea]MBD2151963.1 hypothetical protein [Pseudanabaena cinerea FACHB-1277]